MSTITTKDPRCPCTGWRNITQDVVNSVSTLNQLFDSRAFSLSASRACLEHYDSNLGYFDTMARFSLYFQMALSICDLLIVPPTL